MTKIYVATPAYGCVVANSYLLSLLFLRSACLKRDLGCQIEFIGNESLITRGRNLFVEKFLQSDCTHLLFIDSDISFTPDAVFSMLEADKDVICSIYPKKGYSFERLKKNENPREPLHQRCLDFNINVVNASKIEKGRYCKVLDAATGFMMIKREVILKMKEAYQSLLCVNDVQGYNIPTYVALFDCMIDPETRRYLSEDYAFCRRAQLLGLEIWADVANVLGHEGSYNFDQHLFDVVV
jgi:hypothetical protein